MALIWQTDSPGRKLRLDIKLDDSGALFYAVYSKTEDILVSESRLGIRTNLTDFDQGMTFLSVLTEPVHALYTPPSGKKREYTDHCVKAELMFEKEGCPLRVAFCVYDDGIAYRYTVTGEGVLSAEKEYSEFCLPEDIRGWGAHWTKEYESDYQPMSLAETKIPDLTLPFLAQARVNGNTYWILLSEACLYGEAETYGMPAAYCVSILDGTESPRMKAVFTPQQKEPVSSQGTLQTPYRAIIITDDLNALVNSTLIENLNPPSQIQDTSWIKPGRAAWSWWGEGYFENVPQDLSRQKQYVDFAAENGLEYVTVDAGWRDWINGTIPEICEYAAQKGVGIFLWANGSIYRKPEYATPDNRYHGDDFIDQDTGELVRHIETWASWGIRGIKVDFMDDDSQAKMTVYQNIVNLCAQFGLMVIFHGSTKPCGENRTWPHIMTCEGVRGLEHYLDWFPVPNPRLFCIQPFLRNIVGAMDSTPVALSNANRDTSTAFQLALSVIFQSGIQHFADSIDIYNAWLGTELLRLVPATWDETLLVDGFPGEFVVMARRKGDDWFIGGAFAEARELSLTLPFLPDGKHSAYLYHDGASADHLEKTVLIVDSHQTISLSPSDSGGFAMLISDSLVPVTPDNCFTFYNAGNAANLMTGTAKLCRNPARGGITQVEGIGNGEGTLTFGGITVPKGEAGAYRLRIHYLSPRNCALTVRVNEEPETEIPILLSSGSDNLVRIREEHVQFREGENTVRLYHKADTSQIDCISICKL